VSPEQFSSGWEEVCSAAREAGRDPTSIVPALHQLICVGSSSGDAKAMAQAEVARRYGPAAGEKFERYAVAGTPDECATRLREFVDRGARHLVFSAILEDASSDAFLSMARTLMDEIRPRVM
jgi:alkanesulfonate monooxygenase SsuD/methylene tetrahydromethanopterin reductase-like flavin-dependent oxidoreductase (luciferase family)